MNITCALIGHLVGDYLCQNDWMAFGKRQSNWICLLHSFIWSIMVCMFGQIESVEAFAFLLATHFLIDRYNFIPWWMELIGQDRFRDCDRLEINQEDNDHPEFKGFKMTSFRIVPGLGPWSSIVVDNIWHIVTIWMVYILT